MAKEKKRGFFSWLGFGKEEEKQPVAEEQTQEVAEPAEQQAEQDAPALSQAEAQAEETVVITETVAGQQREAEVTAAAPHESVPAVLDEAEPIEADPEPRSTPLPLQQKHRAALSGRTLIRWPSSLALSNESELLCSRTF